MASLDHSSVVMPAAAHDDRPTAESQGVVATVLGIVALIVVGVVIIVAVVRIANTLSVTYLH